MDKSEEAGEYIVHSFVFACVATDILKNKNVLNISVGIYCIRHAIELLQKGLLLGGDIFTSEEKVHCLCKVNLKIKEVLTDCTLFKNSKILNKVDIEGCTFEEKRGFLLRSFNENLQNLSKKYTNHTYLKKQFSDPKNLLLRYPDNSSFIKEIRDLIEDETVIAKMIEDAEFIKNFYGLLLINEL